MSKISEAGSAVASVSGDRIIAQRGAGNVVLDIGAELASGVAASVRRLRDSIHIFDDYGGIDNSVTTSGSRVGAESSVRLTGTNASVEGNAGALGSKSAGELFMQTGSTNTGRATVLFPQVRTWFSSGKVEYEARVGIEAASDGTNTFDVVAGLVNADDYSGITKGVYFRYTHDVNSGQWVAIAEDSSGVVTTVNTSVVALLGSANRQRLGIVVEKTDAASYNNAGTIAANMTFFINGVQAAQILNKTMDDYQIPRVFIRKIAGTSTRYMYLDYMEIVGNYAR